MIGSLTRHVKDWVHDKLSHTPHQGLGPSRAALSHTHRADLHHIPCEGGSLSHTPGATWPTYGVTTPISAVATSPPLSRAMTGHEGASAGL